MWDPFCPRAARVDPPYAGRAQCAHGIGVLVASIPTSLLAEMLWQNSMESCSSDRTGSECNGQNKKSHPSLWRTFLLQKPHPLGCGFLPPLAVGRCWGFRQLLSGWWLLSKANMSGQGLLFEQKEGETQNTVREKKINYSLCICEGLFSLYPPLLHSIFHSHFHLFLLELVLFKQGKVNFWKVEFHF